MLGIAYVVLCAVWSVYIDDLPPRAAISAIPDRFQDLVIPLSILLATVIATGWKLGRIKKAHVSWRVVGDTLKLAGLTDLLGYALFRHAIDPLAHLDSTSPLRWILSTLLLWLAWRCFTASKSFFDDARRAAFGK